jgi:hypothetical protein
MNPSAKQMQSIPESLCKHQVLKALGLEQQEDWFSRRFEFPTGETLEFTGEGMVYFHPDPGHRGSRFVPMNRIKPLDFWPAGTPTGDALRLFLRRWGWLPKAEQPVSAPQDDTKMVV